MCAAKTRGPPRGCARSSALPAVCALMSSLESAGCSGGCLLCSALIAVSYSIQPVELESVQKCSAPWLRLQTIANRANALFHWRGNSLCIRSLSVIQPIFCEARGSSVRGGTAALRCFKLGRRSWSSSRITQSNRLQISLFLNRGLSAAGPCDSLFKNPVQISRK